MGTECIKYFEKSVVIPIKEPEEETLCIRKWCNNKMKDNLLWNITFLTCLALLILQVSNCLDKLLNPAIRSKTNRAADNFPSLPAFVFCYNMPYDMTALKSFGITYNQSNEVFARRNPVFWNFTGFNTSAITLTQLWHYVSANFTITLSNEIKNIMHRETHYHMKFGRCETWRPINDTSGSSIPFATFGFSMAIDEKYKGYWSPEDIPDRKRFRMLRSSIDYMETWHVALFDYRTDWHEFSFVSRFKESFFVNLDEELVAKLQMSEYWLMNSKSYPCNVKETYSTVACEYLCIRDVIEKEHNCTAPWLSDGVKAECQRRKLPECNTPESITAIIRTTQQILWAETPSKCSLKCCQRCQFRTYRTYVEYRKQSDTGILPYIEPRTYFDDPTDRIREENDTTLESSLILYYNAGYTRRIAEEFAYDMAQFVAEIGGSVGLFLGLSVLGLTHLLQDAVSAVGKVIKKMSSKRNPS